VEISDRTPLLSFKGVFKYYGAMAAVDDLSCDVQPGEILGIGGPNGAGKTTLFDVTSGLIPASAGEVTFDNTVITKKSPVDICHMGLSRTYQLNAAFETLSLRENILCASYYGPKNVFFPKLHFDRASQDLADEVIEFTGLENYENDIAQDLPILQRKLLMIASALATRPKLILLDEPVGGLNVDEIDLVMNLVRRMHRDQSLTIVLIEHVMRFLVALSDRVMIMHHGSKIYEGSAEGLTKDKTVVEVYLGEGAARRLDHIIDEELHDGHHATS
jgi:branched-chain amino acid transport system ATP-binding protein